MLLEQQINPKIVQKLLGHRDISTTLNVYSHVVPELHSSVTSVVNEASRNLLDGGYTPKLNADLVREQLRRLDPFINEDFDVGVRRG